jgi:hypothetical protein
MLYVLEIYIDSLLPPLELRTNDYELDADEISLREARRTGLILKWRVHKTGKSARLEMNNYTCEEITRNLL